MTRLALILAVVAVSHAADTHRSWASDNGNGTFSNPLFYDEFSGPGMIRVGSDYYLTGTTIGTAPNLDHGGGSCQGRYAAAVQDK